MDAKAEKGYFIGYEENIKGYRVWFPEENIIKVVRDVIFSDKAEPLRESPMKPEDSVLMYLPEVNEENNQDGNLYDDLHEENIPPGDENNLEEDLPGRNQQIDGPVGAEDDLEIQRERVVENQPEERNLRNRASLKPPGRYEKYVNIDEVLIAEDSEPLTYREALSSHDSEKWNKAMQDEMDSLSRNEVWQLVDRPENQTIMDNR